MGLEAGTGSLLICQLRAPFWDPFRCGPALCGSYHLSTYRIFPYSIVVSMLFPILPIDMCPPHGLTRNLKKKHVPSTGDKHIPQELSTQNTPKPLKASISPSRVRRKALLTLAVSALPITSSPALQLVGREVISFARFLKRVRFRDMEFRARLKLEGPWRTEGDNI